MRNNTSPQSESVLSYTVLRHPIFFRKLGVLEIVHTQDIWGTMAHSDRELGGNRLFPTGALATRIGLTAPGALDPDTSRRSLCESRDPGMS